MIADDFKVRVVQGKSGLWAAACRSDRHPGVRGVASKKRSEGAAIRTAVQNYVHIRGPLRGT